MGGRPMNPATKVVAGRRPPVHLDRRADLLHAAGIHHQHAVRQRHRFDLVVRDVQARHAERARQLLDLEPHLHAQFRVEVRERLVEEERRGLADDRAPHRHPLPLPAGELPRLAVEKLAELEDPRRMRDARLDVGAGHAADLEPVGHVVAHVHVRIERVVLEHHGDVPVLRLDVVHDAAADADLPRGDLLQARDHPQQRRLAAARGPDDDHELAVGDLQIHAVHDLCLPEGLAHAAQDHLGHASSARVAAPLTSPSPRAPSRTSAA
jgi:hypothetical protein